MKKYFLSFGLLLTVGLATIVFNSCGDENNDPTQEQNNNPKDDPKDDPKDPLTYDEGVVINGIRWATRNVASHGKFVENPEEHGALFQWGRTGDGHEQRTSPSYPTNDTSFESGTVSDAAAFDVNGQIVNTHAAYGKFIKDNQKGLWRSPQNDALWNSGTATAPVKTVNDPCPRGWRVPTQAEYQSLVDAGSKWTNTSVAGRIFGGGDNTLFLPAASYRGFSHGAINYIDTGGEYWSSTVYDDGAAYALGFGSNYVNCSGNYRYCRGLSVRCVAEE